MKNRASLLSAIRSYELWAADQHVVFDLCWNLIHRSDLDWTDQFTRSGADPTMAGPVRVIPVYGVLQPRSSALDEYFGVTSLAAIRKAFRAALGDPVTRAIVLDFDTPGGSVAGLTELAEEIRAARGGRVRIVSVTSGLMASAGFWLGSQADEVIASPSASVGSVGIIAVHQEFSRALDAEGITTTVFATPPAKAEGNPFEPLTDDAKAEVMSRQASLYGTFVSDVAKGRRVTAEAVQANYGGGRILMAAKALEVGMIDRVDTIDATVARLSGASTRRGRLSAAAAWLEMGAGAVRAHETATADDTWDGAANEARLPSPMAVATAEAAYAWVDTDRAEDDEIVKDACAFIHHEVDADGNPGAANLTACSSGIGICNGGRGAGAGARWWVDRQGIYDHLAAHMRDAEQEPPELSGQAPASERWVALAAEAAELTEWAQSRARLRASEHRALFSTRIEAALRTTRDAIDALLAGDPGAGAVAPPGDPAPSMGFPPPVTPDQALRPVSRAEFLTRLGTTPKERR